jgi:thiol-disulfide isomerase/thioredoxin
MKLLIRVFNHRSFITMTLMLIGIAALLLLSVQISVIDIILLIAIPVLAYIIWRMRVTDQTEEMSEADHVLAAIKNGQRPTVLQFFSRYCAACIAVKPIVDRVEADAGDRLQVIRLDIDGEPGKTLMEHFRVTISPTFLYFDAEGNRLGDSVFALDTWKIQYEESP